MLGILILKDRIMQGASQLETANSTENQLDFIIDQYLGKINTLTFGKILEVKDGLLTVEPLLNRINGDGEPVAPAIIYDVPYAVIRGGYAGILTEPEQDDTVIIGFCHRDISSVKRTEALSNPDTSRRFDLADAVVLAHWSKKPLKVFIKITKDGIDVVAPIVKVNSDVILGGESGGKAVVLEDAVITLNSDCKTDDGKRVTGTAKVTSGKTVKVKAI